MVKCGLARDDTAKDAILILDPLTEWREVLGAIKRKGVIAIAGICNSLEGRDDIGHFMPNEATLYEAGFDFVLFTHLFQGRNASSAPPGGSPSIFNGFDVYSATQRIKLLEKENYIRVCSVIPLSETAVGYCDVVASLLGISSHNPINTVLARSDKAIMKECIADAGLRVAKFARIKRTCDVPNVVSNLSLQFPIVIKTPQGFSTKDAYICDSENDAMSKVDIILNGKVAPDRRIPTLALIEEYIGGEEFEVNMMSTPVRIECTDVWLYRKTIGEGVVRYISADMMDPGEKKLEMIVAYATQVAAAVGTVYGAAYLKLKATYCEEKQQYIDPCMIEFGARISGGRKTTLTRAVVKGWQPFEALIDAHCGHNITFPQSFSPGDQHACQLFLPHQISGKVTEFKETLSTYHSHVLLGKVGDVVERTTDIASFGGFVWLAGPKQAVKNDAQTVWEFFSLQTEPVEKEFNMGRITGVPNLESLWIGNLFSLSQIDSILENPKSAGSGSMVEITILTLLSSSRLKNFARDCVDKQKEKLESKGIAIHHIVVDLKDNCDPNFLSGPLPLAVDKIDDAMCLSSSISGVHKYCLIHCAKGESRSVAVAAAWLMLRRGLTLQDALAKVKRARPNANPNLGFVAALHAIEASNNDIDQAAKRLCTK
uniref:Uncharacterized protein n=2 Tax=Ditylum brightwellii TaxID=49249 RepID=A0A7S2EFX3_9STRA|mmetsp:Transcript_28572/g.42424  ORF Transcript_28572/g.42424 Transcript_28572/m.42424 type:complete len:656 (+) Transcript_28572:178-2145(+)